MDIRMNETPQTSTLRTRLLGLVMVTCSAVLVYTAVYSPLEKAREHANSISISTKAVAIIPLVGILGMMLFLFPKTQSMLWNEDKKLTVLGWVVILGFLALGFVLHYYFEEQLRALGYRF
jgi:hypothetical protein